MVVRCRRTAEPCRLLGRNVSPRVTGRLSLEPRGVLGVVRGGFVFALLYIRAMAKDVSARRIFLASPSGLEPERARLRTAVTAYNEANYAQSDLVFVPAGWESITATVQRPQSAINPLLRDSDYMVLLLEGRWGSPSGGAEGWSSGTEEEFREALKQLADPDSPLRDIWMVFKAVPAGQMIDPGPQLARVLEFRDAVEASRQILFHTVDSMEDLARRFEVCLRTWASDPAPKTAREVAFPVPQGHITSLAVGQQTDDELLAEAENHAANGRSTLAEAAFSRATASHDPVTLLRYAKFLRRVGRLDKSLEIDHEVVALTATRLDDDGKLLAATALANMGVVFRKQGLLRESQQRLREAADVARSAGRNGLPALAYALDNAGWTRLRLGEGAEAVSAFEEAARVRQDLDDPSAHLNSVINLTRAKHAVGVGDVGLGELLQAMDSIVGTGNDPTRANALALVGELQLETGNLASAQTFLDDALTINEAVGNSDGVSVVSALLARVALELGDSGEAGKHVDRSMYESRKSANKEGMANAFRLAGQVAAHEGRWVQAKGKLRTAYELYAEIGDPAREASVLTALAEVSLGAGETADARASLGLARGRAAQVKLTRLDAEIERVDGLLRADEAPRNESHEKGIQS